MVGFRKSAAFEAAAEMLIEMSRIECLRGGYALIPVDFRDLRRGRWIEDRIEAECECRADEVFAQVPEFSDLPYLHHANLIAALARAIESVGHMERALDGEDAERYGEIRQEAERHLFDPSGLELAQ